MPKCEECGGTRHCIHCVSGKKECDYCGGTGREGCERSDYYGGHEHCTYCHGTEYIDCSVCKGKRVVVCNFCDGTQRCHLCG